MDLSSIQLRFSTAHIPPHRTQLHPRMHSLSSSTTTSSASSASASSGVAHSHLKWWSLAAALSILPLLLLLLAVARGIHRSPRFADSKPTGFGVIIHASPDSTRASVFEFLNHASRFPFVGSHRSPAVSAKARPALSLLGPRSSADVLSGLLRFVSRRIPAPDRKDTRVWLLATAPLSPAILASCRRVLRSSGFLFRDEWASIVSGEEQGLYSWIAANYVLGNLGADPEETTGIIELGGASTQVTFAPKEPPPMEFSKIVEVSGVTYNLYSQSILHFGQDAVWELLVKQHKSSALTLSSDFVKSAILDPCIPKGYNQTATLDLVSDGSEKQLQAVNSAGNFSACRSVVLSLFQEREEKCLHPPCAIVGSFMPKLESKGIVNKNFFFTSEFFGMVPRASLQEIEAAGQHFCEGDWAKLREEYYGIDEIDLLRYCFYSTFIVTFLHDRLGISMDDKRIGFANQGESAPLDWTLGAFIKQIVDNPEEDLDNVAHIIGDDIVAYLSLFLVLFLVVLAAFIISKLRKPQLKTVFDLEKGRYIITRVPR